ncbi:MAG: hypothetical protein JWM99_1554 [Verrucomicrobiales bacterium]|jgi:hypothetical protein|nr:hypothetical protein [Verrucomicrobiales bacterium]
MNKQSEVDIIGEIHATREAIAARFKNDLKAIFADAMKRQLEQASRLAIPPLAREGRSIPSEPEL